VASVLRQEAHHSIARTVTVTATAILSAACTRTFTFSYKSQKQYPPFVSKMLPSSGEVTNHKTQLTKNVAHINTIYTREVM
jgi:hypothetical protein